MQHRLQNEVLTTMKNAFCWFRVGFLNKAVNFFAFNIHFWMWKSGFWQKILISEVPSQVYWTLKWYSQNWVKTPPRCSMSIFSTFCGPKTLEINYHSAFYLFWKYLSQKNPNFWKNTKNWKNHCFFTFFTILIIDWQKMTLEAHGACHMACFTF